MLAHRCPNLQHLSLPVDGVSINTHCLQYVLKKFTQLEHLDLVSFVDNVNDEVQFTTSLSKLNQLRFLSLDGFGFVNDETLSVLSQNCSKMQTLNLFCCPNFTDVGLISLCKLQHLSDICLARCKISDIGVKQLAKEGRLQHLSLCYCREITDDSIIDLAKYCPNLTSLNLASCFKVTSASVLEFYRNADNRIKRIHLKVFGTKVSRKEIQIIHPMVIVEWE